MPRKVGTENWRKKRRQEHLEMKENRYYIFGRGGGKRLAEELHIPLLGEIPLVQSIREGGDQGTPVVLQAGHPAAQIFMHIAAQL